MACCCSLTGTCVATRARPRLLLALGGAAFGGNDWSEANRQILRRAPLAACAARCPSTRYRFQRPCARVSPPLVGVLHCAVLCARLSPLPKSPLMEVICAATAHGDSPHRLRATSTSQLANQSTTHVGTRTSSAWYHRTVSAYLSLPHTRLFLLFRRTSLFPVCFLLAPSLPRWCCVLCACPLCPGARTQNEQSRYLVR